ncbi:uncharacterized protein V1510DRAFT_363938 [Dipodascopsis tothii]|uniref:uncharacterized protein n=1 Tax=Dipodascopsis tothii TaxID=44089 RepID=UPI0034CDBBC2
MTDSKSKNVPLGRPSTDALLMSPMQSPPPYTEVAGSSSGSRSAAAAALYPNPKASDSQALLVPSPYYEEEGRDGYFPVADYDEPPRTRTRYLCAPSSCFARMCCCMLPLLFLVVFVTTVGFVIAGAKFMRMNGPEQYATQAMQVNVTSVMIDHIDFSGVHTNVECTVEFDSARVENPTVRTVGRLATTLMRKLSIFNDGILISQTHNRQRAIPLGRASVPPFVIDVRDHHVTNLALNTVVKEVASAADIAKLIDDYIQGHLQRAVFRANTNLTLKTGLLPLGTHHISKDVTVEGIEHILV